MSQGTVVVLMFIGRLGPLTFALALAERFQRRERLRYAEAEISIG
jgi:Trk-type K+ transport system membrane component